MGRFEELYMVKRMFALFLHRKMGILVFPDSCQKLNWLVESLWKYPVLKFLPSAF